MSSDSPMLWLNYILIGGYENDYRTGEAKDITVSSRLSHCMYRNRTLAKEIEELKNLCELHALERY